jgi:hypothetical protein
VLLILAADEIHRRLGPRVLEGVPCWVEVLYSDSMDAKISVDGRIEKAKDISTDDLLRAADEAAAWARRA